MEKQLSNLEGIRDHRLTSDINNEKKKREKKREIRGIVGQAAPLANLDNSGDSCKSPGL